MHPTYHHRRRLIQKANGAAPVSVSSQGNARGKKNCNISHGRTEQYPQENRRHCTAAQPRAKPHLARISAYRYHAPSKPSCLMQASCALSNSNKAFRKMYRRGCYSGRRNISTPAIFNVYRFSASQKRRRLYLEGRLPRNVSAYVERSAVSDTNPPVDATRLPYKYDLGLLENRTTVGIMKMKS